MTKLNKITAGMNYQAIYEDMAQAFPKRRYTLEDNIQSVQRREGNQDVLEWFISKYMRVHDTSGKS